MKNLAQLQKISENRGGKEPIKSNAKSLINDDLTERNQVTKDKISDWHGAFEIKLN